MAYPRNILFIRQERLRKAMKIGISSSVTATQTEYLNTKSQKL
jgi:hypothetical protein